MQRGERWEVGSCLLPNHAARTQISSAIFWCLFLPRTLARTFPHNKKVQPSADPQPNRAPPHNQPPIVKRALWSSPHTNFLCLSLFLPPYKICQQNHPPIQIAALIQLAIPAHSNPFHTSCKYIHRHLTLLQIQSHFFITSRSLRLERKASVFLSLGRHRDLFFCVWVGATCQRQAQPELPFLAPLRPRRAFYHFAHNQPILGTSRHRPSRSRATWLRAPHRNTNIQIRIYLTPYEKQSLRLDRTSFELEIAFPTDCGQFQSPTFRCGTTASYARRAKSTTRCNSSNTAPLFWC